MMENAENAITRISDSATKKKNNEDDVRFTAEKKANLKCGCNTTPRKTL